MDAYRNNNKNNCIWYWIEKQIIFSIMVTLVIDVKVIRVKDAKWIIINMIAYDIG